MEILRFNPTDKKARDQVITCFREVFGGEKWKEWAECPQCQKQWSKSATPTSKVCPKCDTDLEPFWPQREVEAILNELPDKEDLSAWMAVRKQKVVGLCWGFAANSKEWSEEIEAELSKLKQPIQYQSEMGVLPEYRDQGLGSKMYRKRGRDFLEREIESLLVRTKGPNAEGEPSKTYSWYKQLGYSVIYEYEDGRVLQAVETNKVKGYILHS